MREFFRPELRNRIDQICRFQKLDDLAIKKIVVKFLDEVRASLEPKRIRIQITEAAVAMLAQRGYDSRMGARPLSRKIDELIRVPLSRRILFERLTDCDITVDVLEDNIEFRVKPHVRPVVDDEGFIRVEHEHSTD